MADYRIVIADGDTSPRRISKIVTLSDGGYSILAPYHKAREGWLAKHPVDYRYVGQEVYWKLSDMVHYSAEDRVKLTHHWDGFVQFSGESPGKIISGRSALTGVPKGLGLMSAPIWRPIRTGPTSGLLVWGLNDYAEHKPTTRDIVFNQQDIYYRNCSPAEWFGYLMEVWVYDHRMWSGVRGAGLNLRFAMGVRDFIANAAFLEFRVIPLEPPARQFLGILISRLDVSFSVPSGFVLNSPSDRQEGAYAAEAMMAMYPRLDEIALPETIRDLTFVRPGS